MPKDNAPLTTINNAQTLRRELAEAFANLKSGDCTVSEAKELANLAGKMINSAKVQVDYYTILGSPDSPNPKIEFLEEPQNGTS